MDWHPFIVHFPIVLIIASVLLDLGAIAARKPDLHLAGMILFLAGAVTAVPAAFQAKPPRKRRVSSPASPKISHTTKIWAP